MIFKKKKKKKVFAEIRTLFLAEITNSNVSSGQKQVISKKRKRVFAGIRRLFLAEITNSNVFSGEKHVISKKREKKKGLRRNPKAFCGRNHKFKLLLWIKTATFSSQKNTVGRGQEINQGAKTKIGGAMPPAGDAPAITAIFSET